MDRRRFLSFLLRAPLAVRVAAPLAAALPLLAQAQPRQTLLIQESPLAGFQYYEGEKLWPQLSVGTALTLVRESDNRHDKRAVRVDIRGVRLGYLPRLDNAAVSQLMDRGQDLAARIVTLRQDHDPWKRVEIAIEWLQGGVAS